MNYNESRFAVIRTRWRNVCNAFFCQNAVCRMCIRFSVGPLRNSFSRVNPEGDVRDVARAQVARNNMAAISVDVRDVSPR